MDLLATLSDFAARHLPRQQLLALRRRYHESRVRLGPLMRVIHGRFGAAELLAHLDERVGRNFDILMVHSSLNHMRPMFDGDAMELLRVLTAFCGPDRTLAMPAFYFGDSDLRDVLESYRRQPMFDVRRTPSQMGVLTELFRRSQDVRQSLHPTHRVAAIGPLAERLTAGHLRAGSTFGPGTPFGVMAEHDTCILSIGKPIEVLTQVHHVEDLLGDRFPVPHTVAVVPLTIRDVDKTEHAFELRWRQFSRPRDMYRVRQLMTTDTLKEWRFHHVPMFQTRARLVTDALLAAASANRTIYGA